jgi:hypothetical protein
MEPNALATSPRTGAHRIAGVAALLTVAGCATVDLSTPTPSGTAAPQAGTATVQGAATAAPSLGFFSKIKAPDTHEPSLRLAGKGVQVFRCERGPDGTYAWVFRLPEAELLDSNGKVVARHGANFTFEHSDGSRLLGTVLAYDEAPNAGNLRWLLLGTKPFGQGALTGVTHVQRVNTTGGVPPARCEANQQNQLLRVDFSADFVFYKPR